MELTDLINPHILKLEPYTSARDEFTGEASIFLDANENAFGTPGLDTEDYSRYPDPYQAALKKEIASLKGVNPDQIFLGNGSDEPIDLLIRLFCYENKKGVLIFPPTYGMYKVGASINNVSVVQCPLTPDYQLDIQEFDKIEKQHLTLAFLCSPNNPTGNSLNRTDILHIIRSFPGIVVVDEAYVDFMEEPSFLGELHNYPNLVVMQTFSKAWGMAGLRMGMAFASPQLIDWLNKIKAPYNLNILTQQKVMEIIRKRDKLAACVQQIVTERSYLASELAHLQLVQQVHPSDANFLLVKMTEARKVYNWLLEQKIVVRDRSNVMLCLDSLRVTVGTRNENSSLIEALKTYEGS